MKTVFVVDDNEAFLETMKAALQALRCRAVLLRDTVHLSVRLAEERPDLVMLDIQMPGGGAPMAEKLIRENPATKALPILVVTGMPLQDASRWFDRRDPRLLRVVQKPLSLADLRRHVTEMLRKPAVRKPRRAA